MTDYSDALARLRDEHGLSINRAAERAGVGDSTWSKWERGEYNPSDESIEKIERAFEVDLDDYRPIDQSGPTGWVRDRGDIEDWRDAVVRRQHEQWVMITLMVLPSFLDETAWVVSVTPEVIAEHTGYTDHSDDIREAWDQVLESDLVERIGEGRWTLRLVVPDE
ncbi:MAG: helix-turn-helix domain-containing protein [Bradymonadaceae bacterium]